MTQLPASGRPGNLPIAIPYIEALGLELFEMGGGRAAARFNARTEHTNSWGVPHGGVLMSGLDFIMAMAGRSATDERMLAEARKAGLTEAPAIGGGGNVTIEMKTSFLRPGSSELVFRGHCLQSGKSLSFCEAEVVDGEGRIVARATGTFKFLPVRDSTGPKDGG
jgi:acyl-coenzyme A thioesterase PaaI-like protein